MRKIKFTKVLIKLIADCLFDGLTDEEIALLAGLSSKTIQRVRAGDDCPTIKAATLQRKRVYIARIRDGTNSQWQRIAWFLERRYPKEFSKPEVQLQIDASSSSTTNNTLIITAEQAANLRSRSSAIETQLARLTPRQSRDATASSLDKVEGEAPKEAKSYASGSESATASSSKSFSPSASREEGPGDPGTRTPGAPARTPDPTLSGKFQKSKVSSGSNGTESASGKLAESPRVAKHVPKGKGKSGGAAASAGVGKHER
jgi:hypothetical protein